MSSLFRIRCALLLCTTLLFGCGQRNAEFSRHEEFKNLMPEAQQVVDKILIDHFGTPTDMVAWEALPLKVHGAVGLLEGDQTANQLNVKWVEQNRDLSAGQEVLLVPSTKGVKPSHASLKAYQETKLILANAFSETPKAGDRVVVAPGEILKKGRVLYAEHCQHCHGVTGDGKGPTAQYLNVRPRDYRKGIFKFTSTLEPNRAHRSDFTRIIAEGIPGTYMPSFKLLKPEESTCIVEYVLWLAMRGQIETRVITNDFTDFSLKAESDRTAKGETRDTIVNELNVAVATEMQGKFDEGISIIVDEWKLSSLPEAFIVPTQKRQTPDQASIDRGRTLYFSEKTKCASCHGEAGLGDGPQTLAVGTNKDTKQPNPLPGLYDDWGNKLKPRNLRSNIYRGGRRPIDLFCRVHAGIKGTPMPPFGAKLSSAEIWDLVNYVYQIPFEERLPGSGVGAPPPAEAPAPAAALRDEPAVPEGPVDAEVEGNRQAAVGDQSVDVNSLETNP